MVTLALSIGRKSYDRAPWERVPFPYTAPRLRAPEAGP